MIFLILLFYVRLSDFIQSPLRSDMSWVKYSLHPSNVRKRVHFFTLAGIESRTGVGYSNHSTKALICITQTTKLESYILYEFRICINSFWIKSRIAQAYLEREFVPETWAQSYKLQIPEQNRFSDLIVLCY